VSTLVTNLSRWQAGVVLAAQGAKLPRHTKLCRTTSLPCAHSVPVGCLRNRRCPGKIPLADDRADRKAQTCRLAVVHFSGHGAVEDGRLYLLPYEIDARDAVGLAMEELRGELLDSTWANL
jgi:hypothetical protein